MRLSLALIRMHKTQNSWILFNRIASRYDLLNWLLSFNQDKRWRKKLSSFISGTDLKIADIGTGTGDVLFSLIKHLGPGRILAATGIDMSEGMLEVARKKQAQLSLKVPTQFNHGDSLDLPLETSTYDVVTMAFAIRNVEDPLKGLKEIYRVLKPQGKALVLEFSLPQNILIKWVYLLYFRFVLPTVGGVISGDFKAYRYLNKTVEAFPYGEAFCAYMKEAGFTQVKAHPLTFGIATIYVGVKR